MAAMMATMAAMMATMAAMMAMTTTGDVETIPVVAVPQMALEAKMTNAGPPGSTAQPTQLLLVATLQPCLLALRILHACPVVLATREEACTAQPVLHAPPHLEPVETMVAAPVAAVAECQLLGEVEFLAPPCSNALGTELLATSEEGLAALFVPHALIMGLATLQPGLAILGVLEDRAHPATASAVPPHAASASLAFEPHLATAQPASPTALAPHALPAEMATTLATLQVGLLALLVLHTLAELREAILAANRPP